MPNACAARFRTPRCVISRKLAKHSARHAAKHRETDAPATDGIGTPFAILKLDAMGFS
jgi:hypothetical protein